MRAVILLNGEPYAGKIDGASARVYCCDGAYRWAKGKVRIDETLGDFDSLDYIPDPPPSEIYSSEKDETDGEIALFRAIAAGAEEIEIYGGGGKREDHFLGNLHLLYAAFKRGVKASLITNYARIFAAEGRTEISGCKGRTVSVVPFGGAAHIIKSEGFYYPLDGLDLKYGSTRTVSNIVTKDKASFTAQGIVLVIVNHQEEER